SVGLHTDLGTGAHRALIGRHLEVPAIAAQGNGLLRSRRGPRTSPSRRSSTTSRRSPPPRTSAPQRHIFQRKTKTPRGSAPPGAELNASNITRTHRGVPGWVDRAGVVRGDAVVLAVMDQHIGIRDAGGRAVQIVDRRGPVGRSTPVVAVEP